MITAFGLSLLELPLTESWTGGHLFPITVTLRRDSLNCRTAATNATVTVNLNSTVRKGTYWWGEATATNNSFPAYVGITNVAVIKGGGTNGTDLVSTNTGALLWAEAGETLTNDLDGNLTADKCNTKCNTMLFDWVESLPPNCPCITLSRK